jgi:hypothetical protein
VAHDEGICGSKAKACAKRKARAKGAAVPRAKLRLLRKTSHLWQMDLRSQKAPVVEEPEPVALLCRSACIPECGTGLLRWIPECGIGLLRFDVNSLDANSLDANSLDANSLDANSLDANSLDANNTTVSTTTTGSSKG